MKIKHWTVLALGLVMGLDGPGLLSQEPAPIPPPETSTPPSVEAAAPGVPPTSVTSAPAGAEATGKRAVVKAQNVNVRGKAQRKSEVVTQLNRGDQVLVLDEIAINSPQPGEPSAWVRILLPRDVGVWVHGSFVDPASRSVTANRLNMRSGPGENYSVLGQIEQGTQVEVLESKGDWLKIPAPPEAGAYVAAFLVDIQETAPSVVTVAQPTTPTVPATTETTPPVESTEILSPPPSIPVEIVEVDSPAPVITSETDPVEVEVETIPLDDTPVMDVVIEDGSDELVVQAAEPELVKRVVLREGIVNRTVSIQAPTYFMLHNVENGKVINYLYSPSSDIILKDFYGARVIVKGEELLDERWPNTPVIHVESLETVLP